jgi:hypothetical protein
MLLWVGILLYIFEWKVHVLEYEFSFGTKGASYILFCSEIYIWITLAVTSFTYCNLFAYSLLMDTRFILPKLGWCNITCSVWRRNSIGYVGRKDGAWNKSQSCVYMSLHNLDSWCKIYDIINHTITFHIVASVMSQNLIIPWKWIIPCRIFQG